MLISMQLITLLGMLNIVYFINKTMELLKTSAI